MFALLTLLDFHTVTGHLDPAFPHLLDASDADKDHLDDWWLDLGAVDFTTLAGL